MAGKLKMYKEKIDGFKKFYGIVSTIKKVALSKYRTLQVRVKTRDSTQRYTKKVFDIFEGSEEDLIKNATGKVCYFPILTNRGNCGPINSAVYKYLDPVVEAAGKDCMIFCVGKKGFMSLSKLFPDHFTGMACINDDKQMKSWVWASFVLDHLDEQTADAEVDRTQIIFNRFVSAGMQRQCAYNIPSWKVWTEKMSEVANSPEKTDGINNYRLANAIMDKDEEDVKDFYDFHRCIAFLNAHSENELSEAAARIMAVEGQLTNIKELLDKFTLMFNKTRQACVTSALMEIISAKVALEDAEVKSGIEKTRFWEA